MSAGQHRIEARVRANRVQSTGEDHERIAREELDKAAAVLLSREPNLQAFCQQG